MQGRDTISAGLAQPAGTATTASGAGARQADPNPRLARRTLDDLAAGRLALPSLPGIADRLIRLLAGGAATAAEIARIIGADPAITVKVMKAANGTIFRGHKRCRDVESCVVRLGHSAVTHLVTSISLLSVFRSRDPDARQAMTTLWRHSVHVGAVSKVLCDRIEGLDSDQALLAGMLHDIGAIPVIALAAREPDLIADRSGMAITVDRLKGPIGAELLRTWQLSPAIVECARDAEAWLRPARSLGYVDVVQLAQLHAYITEGGRPSGTPPLPETTAFRTLAAHCRMTPELSRQIIADAAREIDAIKALFG